MKAVAFDLVPATSATQALTALEVASCEARPVAGCQSLGPMLNLRLARPGVLVDISQASDLRLVREETDSILYGAALTHAEFEDDNLPDATPGWLPAIARRIAYRAVRNRGTIGGSLAHADPAADWVSTLTALNASVLLVGTNARREVSLDDFITGPMTTALGTDELVEAVRIPRRSPLARWSYWKFCRKVGEFAKASAAVLADPERGEYRVLASAIERKPVLLPDARALIFGTADPAAIIDVTLPFLSPERRALQVTATRRALAALAPSSGDAA